MGVVVSFLEYKEKRIKEGSWPEVEIICHVKKRDKKNLPSTAPLWYWDEMANYDDDVAKALKSGKLKQVKE